MTAPDGLFATPRPVETLADLLANVWQLSYVTTELDRAIEFMADRFGLTDCRRLPADTVTFLAGDQEWARLEALLAKKHLKVDYTVLIPGRVRAGYVDTRAELGHWLEICQLQREDIEFFTALVTESA